MSASPLRSAARASSAVTGAGRTSCAYAGNSRAIRCASTCRACRKTSMPARRSATAAALMGPPYAAVNRPWSAASCFAASCSRRTRSASAGVRAALRAAVASSARWTNRPRTMSASLKVSAAAPSRVDAIWLSASMDAVRIQRCRWSRSPRVVASSSTSPARSIRTFAAAANSLSASWGPRSASRAIAKSPRSSAVATWSSPWMPTETLIADSSRRIRTAAHGDCGGGRPP